jgi:hypothetical protein
MEKYITLNPRNSDYLADFVSNLIQDYATQDKVFSQLFAMPEFASTMAAGVKSFFRQASNQNYKIDIESLSNASQMPKELNKSPEPEKENKNYFGDENSEDVNEILAALSNKNIKTASLPVIARLLAVLGPRLAAFLKNIPFLSSIVPFLDDLTGYLTDLLKQMVKVMEKFVTQFADPDFYKELILSYNAYDAINEAKRKTMYSAEAYRHMLENDGPRGYGGQLHSQGAYEVFSPELKKQVSEQVIKNPEIVKSRFSDDPNLGPLVKKNMGQIISNSTNKFVKVAQQEMSQESQQQLKELQSVMPNWNINTVLKEVYAIYQSPDIPKEQKEQSVDATITKYLRAAQPLRRFLKENDFPTADDAK